MRQYLRLLILGLILLPAALPAKKASTSINVIPYPQSVVTGKGSFSIDDLLMISGRNPHLQIILLTGKDAREQIAFRCRKYPVYVFSLPLRRQILEEVLRMNLFMSGRVLEKESELQRMRKKLNEVGIVTKAKCLLIQMRQMTEEEAHYYLEKRAMDEGLSKKEVAAAVIRLYS